MATCPRAFAACGATTRTWDGSSNSNWTRAQNWSNSNIPDASTENALIESAVRLPILNTSVGIGCLEIQSGALTVDTNQTLTIGGDYFRSTTANQLLVTAGITFRIIMAGAGNQTFENVDPINHLRISTNQIVTFTHPFDVRNSLDFGAGNTPTVVVNANLSLESTASDLTIPSGVTFEVASGATFTSHRNITVDGTLRIKAGSSLVLGNGLTLQINSGGRIELQGANGNVASVTSTGAGSYYAFNVAGTIDADYFRIDRMGAGGLNVTGTIFDMDNGEFHYLATNGDYITLGAAASIPATFDSIGFFDDDGHTNLNNVNATAYAGADTTFDNWSGGVGGEGFDVDGTDKIDWGTQAGTKLTISDVTASGQPPANIGQSSAETLFATYGFALTGADTATDITSVVLTMTGTASSSDIAAVRVYRDEAGGAGCAFDSGVDTQIGSDLSLSGSPPTATAVIPAGQLTTDSDTNVACLHVTVTTSASAQDGLSIQFGVIATDDVVNSTGYAFSDTAGPPVTAGSSTIIGAAISTWDGSRNEQFSDSRNWIESVTPTSTRDCKIGNGTRVTRINVASAPCLNATLQNGGTLNYNSTTNEFAVYGSLTVQTGFTFQNATAGPGVLAMRGSGNQSLSVATSFPGTTVIANTGGASVVDVNGNSTLSGDLNVSDGILRISSGVTLTVTGDVTVASGATLDIEPNAVLVLGNGSTLTVNSGGTLEMVGTVAQSASVTSDASGSAYSVVVNGTIKARYYSFDHLGVNGVSVESGATVDGTHFLQNGTFSYPVANNSTLLKLKRQIPGDTLGSMAFTLSGSTATGTKNIDTTGAGAGTLTVSSYSGDLGGPAFDVDPSYVLDWQGATTTIDVTQDAAGPASVSAGGTYNMGRFGFEQAQAGASYDTINISSLKLTMTGTATASDVSEVRLYYDAACAGSGGSLIGSGSFSGNPASKTFAFGVGDAVVESDPNDPPKRCIFVEYDIAPGATNGATIGVELKATSDFVNDQSYAISGTTSPPINLGTPATITGATITQWTGATNSNWFTATNWTAGLPSSTKSCTIGPAANNPSINGASGTASCKNFTNTGSVTLLNGTSAELEVYGNFQNTGTFTQNNGTIRLRDTTGSAQTFRSSTTVPSLTFAKTNGGTVTVTGGDLTIDALTFPAGSNFTFVVPNGRILTLPNGVTIPAGALEIQGGGTLKIGDGQGITVNGGTFRTSGVNDAAPQVLTNKGKITNNGSGTWFFTATSGTVSLTGFLLENIGVNGLNLSGTTTLQALDGGQFRNLSTSYASVKAFQFNTPNLPATATNVGWNWGPGNAVPAPTDAYQLAASTGCGGNSIDFDQWFGDFYDAPNPDPATKVSAVNCTITISASNYPVSLTSLRAAGYGDAVLVEWETVSEWDHQGFNVYRSTNPLYGYVQVNDSLLRNSLTSTARRGKYRYTDTSALPGTRYYYLVEDVATNGARERHGPVSAVRDSHLPPAPAADADTHVGGSTETGGGSGGSSGVANAGTVALGGGVSLLARTSDSLRIEIVPPDPVYSPSEHDGSQERVAAEGYANTLETGKPELLERTVLVEVDGNRTTAVVSREEVTEGAISSHIMRPAPAWSLAGNGTLVPAYQADPSAYGTNGDFPGAFFQVASGLETIHGKKFVKIRVSPLLYNPVTGAVRRAQRILLDIGLDGQAWETPAPAPALADSPAAVEGVLRLRYRRDGLHELTYEHLEEAGLESLLDGADTAAFRLYSRGQEVPLEVLSGNGVFSPGDALRFWVDYQREREDDYNEVVLSTIALGDSTGAPLRIPSLDAGPAAYPDSPQTRTYAVSHAEEDLVSLLDLPFGTQVDRFYWKRIFILSGEEGSVGSRFAVEVDTPGLIRSEADLVRVTVHLRGRAARAMNPTHHLGLWVNAAPFRMADVTFREDGPTAVALLVPAHYFIDGTNTLTLEAMGDTVPANDYEILDIDRVRVEYFASLEARNEALLVHNPYRDYRLTVTGFSPDESVLLYDVSDPSRLTRLTGAVATPAGDGLSQSLTFAVSAGPEGDLGRRVLALTPAALGTPEQLIVGTGFNRSLRDTDRRADLVVIGEPLLLEAARSLIQARESQGLAVATATPAQVYAEFSHGIRSSEALRDFLTFARESWRRPAPRFVLILGDATYDPRDRHGYGIDETMPVPMERGIFGDFGSDHWLVEDAGTGLPTMAVGRVPTNDPRVVEAYVEKLLDYEQGRRSPEGSAANQVTFFSDEDYMHEGFAGKIRRMAAALTASNPAYQVSYVDRGTLGSDGQMRSEIVEAFGRSPLLLSYLGHGAEDLWGTGAAFTATDAAAVTNDRLPLVLAWNCLNAYFYEADPAYRGIGESLVLNPAGGAVGFWGSTALTVPTAQMALAAAFYQELARETAASYHDVRLGDLVVRAKAAVGFRPATADLIRSWTYLGDPSATLPRSAFPVPASTPAASAGAEPAADSTGGGCGRARSPASAREAVPLHLIFLLWIFLLPRLARRLTGRSR